jgi:hypothetical protein
VPCPSAHTRLLLACLSLLQSSVRLIRPFTSYDTPLPHALHSALPFATFTALPEAALHALVPREGWALYLRGAPFVCHVGCLLLLWVLSLLFFLESVSSFVFFCFFLALFVFFLSLPLDDRSVGEGVFELLSALCESKSAMQSLWASFVTPLVSFVSQYVFVLRRSYLEKLLFFVQSFCENNFVVEVGNCDLISYFYFCFLSFLI